QTHGAWQLLSYQEASQFQHCGCACAVIIGPRTARDRVIVRAYQDDLITPGTAWECHFEVVHRLPLDVEGLPRYLVALSVPGRFDIADCLIERRRTPDMPLTNLPC